MENLITISYFVYLAVLLLALAMTASIIISPLRVKDKFQFLYTQVDKRSRLAALTGAKSASDLKKILAELDALKPLLDTNQYRLAEVHINELKARFEELVK
jgi:hypothetical protein